MYDMGQFGATTKISVTNTAPDAVDRFTAPGPDPRITRYLLTATADCNIALNGDASTSTAFIASKVPYAVRLAAGDTLSYVTATTANLFVTQIT